MGREGGYLSDDRSPEIAIIGGSGFYSLFDDPTTVEVDTPYGPPSSAISIADVEGRQVAFIARHGSGHELTPHRINYRANAWALKELGITRVLGPCAAGSLAKRFRPGDFVVCDQLVDRTRDRPDTLL